MGWMVDANALYAKCPQHLAKRVLPYIHKGTRELTEPGFPIPITVDARGWHWDGRRWTLQEYERGMNTYEGDTTIPQHEWIKKKLLYDKLDDETKNSRFAPLNRWLLAAEWIKQVGELFPLVSKLFPKPSQPERQRVANLFLPRFSETTKSGLLESDKPSWTWSCRDNEFRLSIKNRYSRQSRDIDPSTKTDEYLKCLRADDLNQDFMHARLAALKKLVTLTFNETDESQLGLHMNDLVRVKDASTSEQLFGTVFRWKAGNGSEPEDVYLVVLKSKQLIEVRETQLEKTDWGLWAFDGIWTTKWQMLEHAKWYEKKGFCQTLQIHYLPLSSAPLSDETGKSQRLAEWLSHLSEPSTRRRRLTDRLLREHKRAASTRGPWPE